MPSKTRSEARNSALWRSVGGRRKRLQSMGVRLSEKNREIRRGTMNTTANSQKTGPKHGIKTERDEPGNQDGPHDLHRKLVKQAANDPAHEQYGDKYSSQ